MLDFATRIWRKIAVGEPDDCWEWQGGLARGYGKLTEYLGYDGNRRISRTHRVHVWVYVQTYGTIPDGYVVMHTCDNKKCCNPKHLVANTQQANVQDCIDKGRFKFSTENLNKGGPPHCSELTSQDIEEIREMATRMTQAEIAARKGITKSWVSRIVNGYTPRLLQT